MANPLVGEEREHLAGSASISGGVDGEKRLFTLSYDLEGPGAPFGSRAVTVYRILATTSARFHSFRPFGETDRQRHRRPHRRRRCAI